MREIFKIQLPLSTNEEVPKALAYNKDHSREGMFPFGEDLLRIARGRKKFFVFATVDSKGVIHIDEELLPDQGW